MTSGAPARRFLIGLDDCRYTAARTWLVRDILEMGGSLLLVAEEGQGKSAVAVALTAAIAGSSDFFGKPTERGRVVYVATEKQNEAARRLRISLCGDDRDRVMMAAGLDFTNRESLAAFVAELCAFADAAGEPVSLIVIDTAGRAIGADGDENSTRDATRFVESLDLIRRATGSAVLLVHHARRAEGRARGSQVLPAWADGVAVIERAKGGRVLKIAKSNIVDEGLVLPFAIEAMRIDPTDEGAGTVAVAVPVRHERRPTPVRPLSGDALVAASELERLTLDCASVSLDEWRQACVRAWNKPRAGTAREAWRALLLPESRLIRDGLIIIEGNSVRPSGRVREASGTNNRQQRQASASGAPPLKGGLATPDAPAVLCASVADVAREEVA